MNDGSSNETQIYPRVEAIRVFLNTQDFTPIEDRAGLRRLFDNAAQINLDEGLPFDEEMRALDSLFVELGVPLGDLMHKAMDLYLEDRLGEHFG